MEFLAVQHSSASSLLRDYPLGPRRCQPKDPPWVITMAISDALPPVSRRQAAGGGGGGGGGGDSRPLGCLHLGGNCPGTAVVVNLLINPSLAFSFSCSWLLTSWLFSSSTLSSAPITLPWDVAGVATGTQCAWVKPAWCVFKAGCILSAAHVNEGLR